MRAAILLGAILIAKAINQDEIRLLDQVDAMMYALITLVFLIFDVVEFIHKVTKR